MRKQDHKKINTAGYYPFINAYHAAKQKQENIFLCPLCGGMALRQQGLSPAGHRRCGCKSCGFQIIE